MADPKGLPLPGEPGDTLGPYDTICLRLYIPNNDVLIRSFWGHLWRLDRWFMHEHGTPGDTRATQIAAIYRALLYQAHNAFLAGERCDMPPDNPIVDLAVDCEENTITAYFADESTKVLDIDCLEGPVGPQGIQGIQGETGPPAQIRTTTIEGDVVIQYYDESTEEWVTLVNVTEVVEGEVMDCTELRDCLSDLLDGTSDDPPPATWPDDLTDPGVDQNCLLAKGARAIADQAAADVEDGFIDPQVTVAAFCGILAGVLLVVATGGVFLPVFLSLGAAILAGGASGFASATSETNRDTFECIVYNAIDAEGELNNAALAAAIAGVESEFSGDALAVLFFKTLLEVAGKDGISNAVLAWSITDDDCSQCASGDCEYETWGESIVYEGSGWWRAYGSLTPNAYGEYIASFKGVDNVDDCFHVADFEIITLGAQPATLRKCDCGDNTQDLTNEGSIPNACYSHVLLVSASPPEFRIKIDWCPCT